MQISKQKVPEIAIEKLGLEVGEIEGDPIEEMARYGTRLILTNYLQAEVEAHLRAMPYERTEDRRGSRNGIRERRVACGIGGVTIEYPKVRDSEEPFRSQVLEAWQRKSRTLLEVIPALYVEGLSTRDYKRALKDLWQGAGMSRSTVSRANEQLKVAFDEWRRRSLVAEEIVYLFLDGHYEGVRQGTSAKEAILVAHGIRNDGKHVLLGVYLGNHEDTQSWKLALNDLEGRGLRRPVMVISDGNAGLIRAVREKWQKIARQRCIVHRIRNVLARIPKSEHGLIRKELNRIFYAPSLDEALAAAKAFAQKWQNEYPNAVEVLGTDLEDCLTFFRMPQRHWKRIRTSNTLERLFLEVRRRTRVIGRFPGERSALSLIWSVLDQDAGKWHRMTMDAGHLQKLQEGVESFIVNPIKVIGFEELIAA